MSVVIVQSNGAKQLVGRDDEAVARATGLATSLSIEGAQRDFQESLTSCGKHAGPLAKAEANLNYTDEAITVEVQDDGR